LAVQPVRRAYQRCDDPAVTEESGGPGSRVTQGVTTPAVSRWRLIAAWVGVITAAVLGIGSLSSPRSAVALLVVVAVPVLAALAPAFWISRPRDGEELLWKGWVSFYEDDLSRRGLFPGLGRKSRPGFGRRGLTGGTLELRVDGMHWRAGGVLTPRSQVSGSFFLPWSKVESADVGSVPGKAKALGGYVRFVVGKQTALNGEFFGSRTGLLHGLARSPLGQRP
jgi:hypothetical protein